MRLAPQVDARYAVAPMPDGEDGIFHTLETMRAMVRRYRVDPTVRNTAIAAIFSTPAQDDMSEVEAIFATVRDGIRYTKDVHEVETLASPIKTLEAQVGDCDDMVTLLATLLESVGYATRFVVDAYLHPQVLEHVYLEVLVDGQWVALDPTEPVGVGWAPPDALRRVRENIL